MAKGKTKKKPAKKAKSRSSRRGKTGQGWLWLFAVLGLILVVQGVKILRGDGVAKSFPVQRVLSFKGDSQACGAFQAWGIGQVGGKEIALSDQQNNRVLLFNMSGKFESAITQKEAGAPNFNELSGVTSDSQGNIYVMDCWNSLIRGFDPKGKSILKARVENTYGPRGLDFFNGDFLMADTGVHRIAKVSPSGAILSSWGRRGSGKAEFSDPLDVETDQDGNIYVADSNNHRVEELDSQGKFVRHFDVGGVVVGVAVDRAGRVYASTQENGFVKVFAKNGKYLGQVTDAAAKVPQPIDGIKGLAVTPDGDLLATHRDEVLVLKPTLP